MQVKKQQLELYVEQWTDSNLGKEYIKSVYFIFFSITVRDIDFSYCDIEWFALAMNRDHSVFFFRLHPSTAFQILLLTMMAIPFLLRDPCLQ